VVEVQIFLGFQSLRNRTRETSDTMAATTSTSHGPWKFETRNCVTANDKPVTRIAGQISSMAFHPAKAQISQNGTSSEKNGSWRPIIPDSCSRSSPVTADKAMTGVPRAPYATGAVLAIRDRPEAASGLNPKPISIAAVTATGVPKPAAPSKNAPNANAINSSCSRRSSVMFIMLSCSALNEPFSSVSWCRKMMFSTIQPIGSSPNAMP
jgi:hypothetical protein